jgi:RNA polymerase sigma factor (sigma-70 family)
MVQEQTDVVLRHIRRVLDSRALEEADDAQLLERFAGGRDEPAFTILVKRHGPMVFRVCRAVLGQTQDAEDAFQATFLVLVRKAFSIRKRESLASWLHGVAYRLAAKARTEEARRRARERRAASMGKDGTPVTAEWDELLAVLDEELEKLPERYRVPLVLCYLGGKTHEEIARHLGSPLGTVRSRMARARQFLQERLARRGLVLSAGALVAAAASAAAAGAPPELLRLTVRAAAGVAGGKAASGLISARVAALVEKGLGTMVGTKLTAVAAVLLGVAAAVAGAGALALQTATAEHHGSEVREQPPEPATKAAQPRLPEEAQTRTDRYGDPLPADVLARLGTIRFRHGALPCAIEFAPDGRSLASAGLDGVVHIWETATGKELLRIDNERFPDLGLGAVFGLAFSPDGKTLAGARINQPPCLWDVTTGQVLREFGGDRQRARWVVFSPDGKMLTYGGGQDDPVVRLADVSTGKNLHRFGGHKGFVTKVAFSPDGTTLASADEETIRLIDIAASQSRTLAPSADQAVRFGLLAFSSDGKTLAAANHAQKLIRFVEVTTGKVIHTITLTGKREEVNSILFTPDGKEIVSGHEDGSVRFWDVASGTKTRQFRAHWACVIAIALSPDGRVLATSSNSHVDGEHAVRLWETATGKPLVRHLGPQQGIAQLVFSPDSQRVATASWETAVHLWEAATGKLLHHWPLLGPLAFTPDGQSLICGGWADGKVRFLDLATGKETRQFSAHGDGIRCLALAPDGKTLVSAGGDNLVRLWDLATDRPVHDFGGKQKSFVFRIALSPDGKLLATLHQDYAVRLWEVVSGKLVREHPEANNVGSVAFSPDGKLLASTFSGVLGRDPLIRLRDVATGNEICQLRGEGDPLDTVAFSPDGRTLIWGGQHRKDLYLWEVATGQLRRKFSGHQGHLSCVAFSPDGRTMASGGSDACVLIWDATGQRSRQQRPSSPWNAAQLDQLWADLATDHAATAYQAICTLRASPGQALPFIEKRLRPVPLVDVKRIAEAIRRLDSEQFTVRDQATAELEQLGDAAEAALRRALADKPSLEVRRRVERLLERLDGAEQRRRARALEVLENIGSPESRRVLSALARGAPDAYLTQEAQTSLDRLGR